MVNDCAQVDDALADMDRAESNQDEFAESATLQRWRQLRCYGFELGPYPLLVSQGTYCEVLRNYQVAPLPNAPPHSLGLTNVRGELVPIYRLDSLVGTVTREGDYALLIGKPPTSAALVLPGKPVQFDLAKLRTIDMPAELPELLRSVVTAAYEDGGKCWLAFDHDALFTRLVGRA